VPKTGYAAGDDLGQEDAGESGDGTHRQVGARGDQDERHTQRDDPQAGYAGQQVLHVLRGEEAGLGGGEPDEQQDGQHQDRPEQPRPLPPRDQKTPEPASCH
jgi:hypothetical protein